MVLNFLLFLPGKAVWHFSIISPKGPVLLLDLEMLFSFLAGKKQERKRMNQLFLGCMASQAPALPGGKKLHPWMVPRKWIEVAFSV